MNSDFVKAVDPIIEMMISVKEQIEKNSGLNPASIREAFLQSFSRSEKFVYQRPEEWNLARYALIAWIDEQLASALVWAGSGYWKLNRLESSFYRNQSAREAFFENAAQAERLPEKDVVEVYFLCVMLGFKGIYDTGTPGFKKPQDLGLPESLSDWVRKTRNHIKLNDLKVTEKVITGQHDSSPLTGKYQFLGMAMTFLVTAIFAGLMLYLCLITPSRDREKRGLAPVMVRNPLGLKASRGACPPLSTDC